MSAYISKPFVLKAQMAECVSPKVRDCLAARGHVIDPKSTGAERNAMVGDDIQKRGQDPGYSEFRMIHAFA